MLRELTKLHEELWRGTLGEALARTDEVEPRGEYVVVVEGAAPDEPADDAVLRAALAESRDAGRSTRDAVDEVAARFGAPRRHVYALALEVR